MELSSLEDEEEGYEYVYEEVEEEQVVVTTEEEAPKKKKKWYKKKYILPSVCIKISWTMAILSCITAAFFVILYSMQWGKTISEEWLSSLFLGVIQSVIVVQPVKVIHRAKPDGTSC